MSDERYIPTSGDRVRVIKWPRETLTVLDMFPHDAARGDGWARLSNGTLYWHEVRPETAVEAGGGK